MRLGNIIKSVKHYHHLGNTQIASGAISVVTIVDTVAFTTLPTATNDVTEGSVIKAVYCEVWVKGEGATDADTQFNLALFKNPNGNSDMSFANIINLSSYDNKNNVLYASQGVIGGIGGGQSVPVIRSWIKIPKGKQRFGRGDQLQIGIATTGQTMQHCGIFVYKEYQ